MTRQERSNLLPSVNSDLYVRIASWLYYASTFAVMAIAVNRFHVVPLQWEGTAVLGVGAAYAIAILYLHHIYHACQVGLYHVSELVLSQALATLLTDVALYICSALFLHKVFTPFPLLLVYLIQVGISVGWCLLTNATFFSKRRPPRTVVFYSNEEALQQLLETPNFSEKYNIVKLIENPQGNIQDYYDQLAGCEAVFTVGIPATMSNGIAKYCVQNGIKGFFVPHLGHIIMSGAHYLSNFNMPVLRVDRAGGHSEYRFIKRMMDVTLSLIALIVASPVMLVTALCIWREDHGPVFYKQIRLTRNGREFSILKFRSMSVNAEADGVARLAGANDSRITKVGKIIRACRIDELPQLINILKGDMSIVGPRPERPEIAKEYEKTLPEFALRLQVKAGLTGHAQVYGRYNTTPYTKLQMDLMYITQMSFLADLKLMFATVKILFVKDSTQGIQEGQTTALMVGKSETGANKPGKSA